MIVFARIAFTLVLCLVPWWTYALDNAGIVDGLWYDPEPFFVGDTVRIYVAVRNHTDGDMSGTVDFFDGDTLIGKSSFTALRGHVIESWVDWTATMGTHRIRATISRSAIVGSDGSADTLTTALAEDVLTVERDTDGDDIGDAIDTDDDNDGTSDEEETTAGTDPLTSSSASETTSAVGRTTSRISGKDTDTEPDGIEEYLADNAAQHFLTDVTDVINTSKQRLDVYRAERATDDAPDEKSVVPTRTETGHSSSTGYSAEGFGTVERTTTAAWTSWFSKGWDWFLHALSSIYTFLLYLLSHALGYPALVELFILIGIPASIYYVSRRLARRPRYY